MEKLIDVMGKDTSIYTDYKYVHEAQFKMIIFNNLPSNYGTDFLLQVIMEFLWNVLNNLMWLIVLVHLLPWQLRESYLITVKSLI